MSRNSGSSGGRSAPAGRVDRRVRCVRHARRGRFGRCARPGRADRPGRRDPAVVAIAPRLISAAVLAARAAIAVTHLGAHAAVFELRNHPRPVDDGLNPELAEIVPGSEPRHERVEVGLIGEAQPWSFTSPRSILASNGVPPTVPTSFTSVPGLVCTVLTSVVKGAELNAFASVTTSPRTCSSPPLGRLFRGPCTSARLVAVTLFRPGRSLRRRWNADPYRKHQAPQCCGASFHGFLQGAPPWLARETRRRGSRRRARREVSVEQGFTRESRRALVSDRSSRCL